ncbi:hypothetical protein GCM10010252_28540 [Streptomyces aureoverticillatus]|nr:hypothetical protein GCM10010252_28540 [Streptomyces aureoverticillatus]
MSQSNPTFAELIADCQESAVHLETRDVYAVTEEDEDFVAWRAGRSYDLADRDAWWTAFHQTVSDAVARGVVFRRARIVSEPVTDYIRYEHACTPQNIMAGEGVRWLPRRLASGLLIPTNDLWIFDRRLVRFALFSGEGRFLEDVIERDPDVAKRHADAFDAVWERAVPHEDYEIR